MSLEERLDILESKLGVLEKIEAMLNVLAERQQVREWYTTHEFAQAVSKAEFTIREYCRLGRLRAEKRQSGRGAYPQWVLSHAELERYRRNGLLPKERDIERKVGQ
jgi:hypothetical protein